MFTLENVSDIAMVFAQLSTFAMLKIIGSCQSDHCEFTYS